MSRVLLGLILSALLFTSCNRKIGFSSRKDVMIDEVTFDFMSARARINYDDGVKDISGTANIRMAYDSAIWVSITPGLGIEAARLLITQDSVFFIDKINKKYMKLGYPQMSKVYQFDINYRMIQSLVLGNLIYPFPRQNLKKEETTYSYVQRKKEIEISNHIGIESKKLERFDAIDLTNDNTITVSYQNFKEIGSELFPYDISAFFEYKTGTVPKTRIEIGFSKASFEDQPLNFPFSIPSKYTSY